MGNNQKEARGRKRTRELVSISFYQILSLSRVFDLVSNFNFSEMPSIQDRLEAFDVVERRTKDMAEQLEAIVARIPENPNVTP